MGQTLTHGVYLPDEGERNCYAGLAANWQLLDNSVGTIAEHTTALAGKAPAVHTHTKSDITDFPAFGNAAGTICEGNDARLSDARTPVAHTHVTADVTDLLDSAHTWSGIQTFGAKVISQTNNTEISGEDIYQCLKSDSKRAISFRVSNNSNYRTLLLGVHDTINSPPKGLVISNDNSNYISVYSDSPKDLGTSTNKWKTLNGVNPGALSLPNMSSGTGVSLSAGSNSYSPPSSGWLSINLTGAISVVCGNFCHSGTDMLSVPVVKGSTYTVTVATSGTAYLFVSQGNV